MYWMKEHNLPLVREVLTVDQYGQSKGSREREGERNSGKKLP